MTTHERMEMAKTAPHKRLSPLMKRFVKEYPIDFNGAQAYMRASGTTNKKSAATQASKFLAMEKVQEALEIYLDDLLGPQEKRLIENVRFWEMVRDGNMPGENKGRLISKKEVLEILKAAGIEQGDDLFDAVDDLPDYEVSITKTTDRMKASENLGKYSQMFVEKKDVQISGQVQIVDDIK